MSLRLCGYLKSDGLPCASPALRGQGLCYFHQRDQQYRLKFSRDRRRSEICDWQLPPLNSLDDIQHALHRIMNELWSGRLDPKRAYPMLNTTRQASARFKIARKRTGESP